MKTNIKYAMNLALHVMGPIEIIVKDAIIQKDIILRKMIIVEFASHKQP